MTKSKSKAQTEEVKSVGSFPRLTVVAAVVAAVVGVFVSWNRHSSLFLIFQTQTIDARALLSAEEWKPWDDPSVSVPLALLEAKNTLATKECEELYQVVREQIESGELGLQNLQPIDNALATIRDRFESRSAVFAMLNGANQGIEIPYFPGCDATLARAVLAAHGFNNEYPASSPESEYDVNPLYLYSVSGIPIFSTSHSDNIELKRSDYMIHVLRHGERFMWPGIRKGFTWTVDGVTLKTLSLEPRVIFVKDALNEDEMNIIIEEGSKHLYRSPEKHYSDDDKFKNYRTSETGSLRSSLPQVARLRHLAHRITRLPTLDHVEPLMFLRYVPGKWYKEHQDTFHHFQNSSRTVALETAVEWLHRVRDRLLRCAHPVLGHSCVARQLAMWLTSASSPALMPDSIPAPSPMLGLTNQLQWAVGEVLAKKLPDRDLSQWLLSNVRHRTKHPLPELLAGNPSLLPELHRAWASASITAFENVHGKFDLDQRLQVLEWLATIDITHLPARRLEVNRFATLLPYLTEVDDGGETVFPYAKDATNAHPPPVREGMPECSRGLSIKPVKGSAALFYHLTPQGLKDSLSTHGGCPPVKGRKDAINVFMWNLEPVVGYEYFD